MAANPAIASGTEIRQNSRSRRVRRLKGARATAPAAAASPAPRRPAGRRAGESPARRPPGEVTGIALPTGSLSRARVPAG